MERAKDEAATAAAVEEPTGIFMVGVDAEAFANGRRKTAIIYRGQHYDPGTSVEIRLSEEARFRRNGWITGPQLATHVQAPERIIRPPEAAKPRRHVRDITDEVEGEEVAGREGMPFVEPQPSPRSDLSTMVEEARSSTPAVVRRKPGRTRDTIEG